jgi:hypothetical protein
VRGNDRCVCERVSSVARIHGLARLDRQRNRDQDAGLADHRSGRVVPLHCLTTFSIAPSYRPLRLPLREQTSTSPRSGLLRLGVSVMGLSTREGQILSTLHEGGFGRVTSSCTLVTYDQTVNPRNLIGMFRPRLLIRGKYHATAGYHKPRNCQKYLSRVGSLLRQKVASRGKPAGQLSSRGLHELSTSPREEDWSGSLEKSRGTYIL